MTTVAVAKPHPLKGIINSNDDPMACARCSQPLNMGHGPSFFRMECCGKWICPECDAEDDHRLYRCIICSWPKCKTHTEYLAMLKRAAKKGHAWGQHQLGQAHFHGEDGLVKQSFPDAFRWLSKSAKKGNPESHMMLGQMHIEGYGCAIDFKKARYHLEVSLSLVDDLTENSQHHLTTLAKRYIVEGSSSSLSEAISILRPLAEDRMLPKAQFYLGSTFLKEGNCLAAFQMFNSSALFSLRACEIGPPAFNAFICAKRTGQLVQVRLWSRIAKEVLEIDLRGPHLEYAKERPIENHFRQNIAALADSSKMLRSARDTCGGCGAEFEGKERKFCRGCRTYCYCNRECQKLHWNRKNDGHRDACKAAIELRKTIKEARQNGLKLGTRSIVSS